MRSLLTFALFALLQPALSHAAPDEAPEGFESLFNGNDLTGWIIPEGDNDHWKVIDGVIDYDSQSEAKGDKNLWTAAEYGDFELKIDWRLKRTTGFYDVPYVLPDGSYVLDADGKKITHPMPNADSGIYLRGASKYQLNIWCWPIGSGEMYGIRNNPATDPEVRAGVTPKLKADNPIGEWNTFHITMKGDRLTVVLNGHTVIENALIPEIPQTGKIALQHHGGKKPDGTFSPASSLVQFRNIFIKELK
ncbi:DUF1080 domain-containing protein [Verrucomicrobiales bacterium BCK34]|nr:DUF1080 domain-containing protein [Verrucomicrobiales bacterium BCK34]